MEAKHNVKSKWKKRYIDALGRLRLKTWSGLGGHSCLRSADIFGRERGRYVLFREEAGARGITLRVRCRAGRESSQSRLVESSSNRFSVYKRSEEKWDRRGTSKFLRRTFFGLGVRRKCRAGPLTQRRTCPARMEASWDYMSRATRSYDPVVWGRTYNPHAKPTQFDQYTERSGKRRAGACSSSYSCPADWTNPSESTTDWTRVPDAFLRRALRRNRASMH